MGHRKKHHDMICVTVYGMSGLLALWSEAAYAVAACVIAFYWLVWTVQWTDWSVWRAEWLTGYTITEDPESCTIWAYGHKNRWRFARRASKLMGMIAPDKIANEEIAWTWWRLEVTDQSASGEGGRYTPCGKNYWGANRITVFAW